MTLEEIRAALAYLAAEMRNIHQAAITRGAAVDASERSAAEALTEDEQTRWDAGQAEIDRLKALEARHVAAAALPEIRTESGFDAPNTIVRAGEAELYDLSTVSYGNEQGVRDKALAVIERASVGGLEDHHRAEAERLVRSLDPSLAARIVATTNPLYRQAWLKVAGGRPELLRDNERAALEVGLERAVTLAGTAGYAVPAMLDPTIIATAAAATNPIRQLATNKKITGTAWKGVTSDGVTASWAGEGVEATDDAPTLDDPEIKAHKAHAFVPFSLESEDWSAREEEIMKMITRAKGNLEAAAYISGNGTTAAKGIVTALDGTAREIAPGTAETFAKGDIDKLILSVAAEWRANAVFLANLAWYMGIKAFETTVPVGSLISTNTPGIRGNFTVAGYPAYEASTMDAALPVASVTADNFGMIFGDVEEGYYTVDRVGLSMELVAHLFHTGNNRPSGMRGFYAWWRSGGDVVVPNALAVLSIPTTA